MTDEKEGQAAEQTRTDRRTHCEAITYDGRLVGEEVCQLKRDAPSRRVSKKLDERVMTESTRLDRTPGCQLTLLVTSKIPCKVPHTHKIAGYLPIYLYFYPSIYLSTSIFIYLSIYS